MSSNTPWAVNLTLWLKITHLLWCMCVCQVWLIISRQMLVCLCACPLISGFWSPRFFLKGLRSIFETFCNYLLCASVHVYMRCMCTHLGLCTHLGYVHTFGTLPCGTRVGLHHILLSSLGTLLSTDSRARLVAGQWFPFHLSNPQRTTVKVSVQTWQTFTWMLSNLNSYGLNAYTCTARTFNHCANIQNLSLNNLLSIRVGICSVKLLKLITEFMSHIWHLQNKNFSLKV